MPNCSSTARLAKLVVLGLCAALWLTGCASQLQYRDVIAEPSRPRQIELADTPFHAQTVHHCGPAALAMLLNATAVPVLPEDLANLTYLPGREGSLALELLATPRHYQRMGYQVQPKLDALLAEVAAGRPVMILQNLGLSWIPRWHFAVLIGYDLDQQEVILRSGTLHRVTMPLDTFERTWLRGERWAMITLAPGETPARPREVDYLQAAIGLEKVGYSRAAGSAYQRAVELWPDSKSAWMALGNQRYSSGALTEAGAAYRRVIALDERFAPAHNNLAQVLLEQADWDAAERAVQQALENSDSHDAVYRQTLEEIRRGRSSGSSGMRGDAADEPTQSQP